MMTLFREEVDGIHHMAHGKCFIANSVKTEITIVPG
jgi:organic hydroperoxide reductase OsmC/OhrA